jgi:uncharacterized protein
MKKIILTMFLIFTAPLSFSNELMFAIENNDIVQIEEAINRGADVNKVYPEYGGFKDMTPLVWAVKKKNEHALLSLLNAGANPNSTGGEFRTPAASQVAVTSSLSTKTMLSMLDALVKHGADLKKTNKYGGNALHSAAYTGRKEVVEFLINAGVPIVRDADGQTPVDIAKMFGGTSILGLLEKD